MITFEIFVVTVVSLALGFFIGINYKKQDITIPVGQVKMYSYGERQPWRYNTIWTNSLDTKDLNEAKLKLAKKNARRFSEDENSGKLVELYYREVE